MSKPEDKVAADQEFEELHQDVCRLEEMIADSKAALARNDAYLQKSEAKHEDLKTPDTSEDVHATVADLLPLEG